jgi:hypothetical protein
MVHNMGSSFPTALSPCRLLNEHDSRQGSDNLFGLETGRHNRHPALDTLTVVYATGNFVVAVLARHFTVTACS